MEFDENCNNNKLSQKQDCLGDYHLLVASASACSSASACGYIRSPFLIKKYQNRKYPEAEAEGQAEAEATNR